MTLSEGDVIAGKYELKRPIGEGGMGIVFAANHKQLGTQVAIKILRDEVLADPEAVARFDREARAAASLDSPHVLRIFDVGRLESGVPYMVSELLDGVDLGVELDRRKQLPLAEAAAYVAQAAEAMAAAHARGVIHRDLKPTNLFLTRPSGRTVLKILDFGISKVIDDANGKMTTTQSAFGTPLYMSPEQVRSTKTVDHRTDVWSLGVIFYELVTGTMPFRGETLTAVAVSITVDPLEPPSHRNPELPKEIDVIVATALAKAPEDRFESMMAFCDAVRPFADGFVQGSATPSMIGASARSAASVLPSPAFATDTEGAVEPRRGPPWKLVLLAAVASFTVLTLAGYAMFLRPPSPQAPAASEPAAPERAETSPTSVETSAPAVKPTEDPVVTPSDVRATPTASGTARSPGSANPNGPGPTTAAPAGTPAAPTAPTPTQRPAVPVPAETSNPDFL